jgi:hypothetical protein
MAEINRARKLDPLSLIIAEEHGDLQLFDRRYDEAIAVCQRLATENPTLPANGRRIQSVWRALR